MRNFIYSILVLIPSLFTGSSWADDIPVSYNIGCHSSECLANSFASGLVPRPFLHLGQEIEEQRERLGLWRRMRYRTALWFFPDAASCLADAKTEEGYDLARIDWGSIANAQQMEVCFFRIHSVMPDARTSQIWYEAVGFRTILVTNPKGHFREGFTTVHAVWASDLPFPGRIGGFASGVQRDDETRVFNVAIDFTVK